MKTSPEYRIEIDGAGVAWSLRPDTESELRWGHTVHMGDLPYEYYESFGFRRVSGTEMAYKKLVLKFLELIMKKDFEVSGGRPIIWQCSRDHAAFYMKAIERRHPEYRATILRGSLREDNPYPPLIFGEPGDDDYSSDDHLIIVEKI